jgi:hypothetical protein
MAQQAGMFTGVETFTWSLSDFDAAVTFAKSLNFTQLIVKVYEITQGDWYQSLGGSKVVFDHIKAQGMDVLPYGYFYGFNPGVEVSAANNYLHQFGKFCLDMESEFDGNQQSMMNFANGLHGHVGDLYISTWANPVDHNWTQNIAIMDPLVKVWMPQVYTSYLAQVYVPQWGSNPKLQPTFNAFSDGTPVSTWHGVPAFSVWEYQGLLGWSQPDKDFLNKMLTPNVSTAAKQKQFDAVWYNPKGGVPAGYQSGIYKAVLAEFMNNSLAACYPTSDEIATVDWNDNPILFQTLSNGYHAEFFVNTGNCLVFLPQGSYA